MLAVNININTNLKSVEEFKDLVISYEDGAVIKLSDVGTVSLGSEEYDSSAHFDGQNAVFIGIQVVPNGNVLTVLDNVREVVKELTEELPQGLNAKLFMMPANIFMRLLMK